MNRYFRLIDTAGERGVGRGTVRWAVCGNDMSWGCNRRGEVEEGALGLSEQDGEATPASSQ